MNKKLSFLMVPVLLLGLVFVLTGCPSDSGESDAGVNPVPEFNLEKIEGGTLSSADLKGKVVAIDLWASWCSPCRSAIPYMEKLHEKYTENDDVIILGINLDYNKSLKEVEVFAKKNKMNYLQVKGTRDVASKFKVRGIPAFFLIDQDGNIDSKWVGFSPAVFQQMESKIEKLLED